MVRCVKACLKKHMGWSSLTFEELRNILVEIKAILSNRPLIYVYDDENGAINPIPADLWKTINHDS